MYIYIFLFIHARISGHEVKPHDIGLVGRKGTDDHQPFMLAFFKVSRELQVQRTRAARKKRSSAPPYAEEDGWRWGPEPCKTNKSISNLMLLVANFANIQNDTKNLKNS